MATTLSATNHAKQDVQYLVFGYVRQQTNGVYIPQSLEHLCLQFYYTKMDAWDTTCMNEGITVQENRLVLSQDKALLGTSSFLTEIVAFGIFEWNFKCHHLTQSGASTFGVWKLNDNFEQKDLVQSNCFPGNMNKYAFGCGVGAKSIGFNDVQCSNDDVITMILNLDVLQLSFKVNYRSDPSQCIAIEPGQYRGVVNLSEHDSSVTLIE